MYLVLLLAAGAILGGVVVVAMGRGGELAAFSSDNPVLIDELRTPAEIAGLRLPLGPIGYRPEATWQALHAAATAVAQRDEEIAALRQELGRLGGLPAADDAQLGAQPGGAATDQPLLP